MGLPKSAELGVQSHYMWLRVTAHEIRFEALFIDTWRERGMVFDIVEEITGRRENYGVNTKVGSRRDLSDRAICHIREGLNRLENRIGSYKNLCMNENTVLKKTVCIGLTNHINILALWVAGPTLRASCMGNDSRVDNPYDTYGEISFNVILHDGCDVVLRLLLRCNEILENRDCSPRFIRYSRLKLRN